MLADQQRVAPLVQGAVVLRPWKLADASFASPPHLLPPGTNPDGPGVPRLTEARSSSSASADHNLHHTMVARPPEVRLVESPRLH